MKYHLAPLAGFTDAPFRLLCRECGADFAYTEMVSAAALARGSEKTRLLLETMPGEGAVACQIFGSDEKDVALAARAIPGTFAELNLNAGCPVPKIVREGAGAKLVEDPAKVFRLLKAISENTPLPVTLKTRIGPRRGEKNALELLDAAESAGAKAITFHARYSSMMHGGPPDLDALAEVATRARIPVCGNGGVKDAGSAAAMAATGVDAIMVGRAAVSNPRIFAALKGAGEDRAGEAGARELFGRHIELLCEFRKMLAERHPNLRMASEEKYVSLKVRTHLCRYFSGMPGAAAMRARLSAAFPPIVV